MRAITLALLLATLALGAAACGGGGSNSGSTEESGSGSGKTEVEMDDYYFQPKTVTGKAGDKITLELKNEGNTEHNFTLEDQGVDQDVEAGEEAEVDVTIPSSGKLTFYCKYHRSRGMTGTLASGSSMSGSGSSGSTSTGYGSG